MKHRFWTTAILMLFSMMLVSVFSASMQQADPAPQSVTATPPYSYVNRDNIYVRGGPAEFYQPVGSLRRGDRLIPLSRNADSSWVLIAYYRGYGWVRRDLGVWVEVIENLPEIDPENLTPTASGVESPVNPVLPTDTPAGNWITAGALGAYVRTGPGLRYPVYGELAGGTLVEPVGRNSDTSWILIRMRSGFAWINRRLVSWSPTTDLESLPVLQVSALTPSATFTQSDTPTLTATVTATATLTDSATPTASATPSSTATATYTVLPTETPTLTETPSATFTATLTTTNTATATPVTPTETASGTPTASATNTFTAMPSATTTSTNTPAASSTPTATSSATDTPSATATATLTHTANATATATLTQTPSATATSSPTDTASATPTSSPTDTTTATHTATSEQVIAPDIRASETRTESPSTATGTATPTIASTSTETVTSSATSSATDSATASATTAVSTSTATETATIALTDTPAVTAEETAALLPTEAPTLLPSATQTVRLGAPVASPTSAVGDVQAETQPPPSSGNLPVEALVGGGALLLVIGYAGLYWRGLAALERYQSGFVIERCPACGRGHLEVETHQSRVAGIPRARYTVRCDNCRSVLRAAGGSQWRYAVDRMANPALYERYNNKLVDETILKSMANGEMAGKPAPKPHVRPPATPPTFIDIENDANSDDEATPK